MTIKHGLEDVGIPEEDDDEDGVDEFDTDNASDGLAKDYQNNIGFEIEDMEGYFLRELMENMREQGMEVPEEFIPDIRKGRENDLYRRMKDHERLSLERQEDKASQWSWSDTDEDNWAEELKARGYNVVEDMDGYHVEGTTIEKEKTSQ